MAIHRLKARVSDPQPIMTSFRDDTPAMVADLLTSGLDLATDFIEMKEEKEQQEALVTLEGELMRNTDAGLQSMMGATAISMRNKVAVQTFKEKYPELRVEANSSYAMSSQNPGLRQALVQESAVASASASRREKTRSDMLDLGLIMGIQTHDSQYQSYMGNLRVFKELEMENDIAAMSGTITTRAMTHSAYADANLRGSELTTKWISALGSSPIEFENISKQDRVTLTATIDRQMIQLREGLHKDYLEFMSADAIENMMTFVKDRASYTKRLLNNEFKYDVYVNLNNTIDAHSKFLISPNPQAKVLNTVIKELHNSRNYKVLGRTLLQPGMLNLVQEQYSSVVSQAVGMGGDEGGAAIHAIPSKSDRSKVVSTIYQSLTTGDIDLSDDTAKYLANALSSSALAMKLDPRKYDVNAWSGLVNFAASTNGKEIMNDPKFSHIKTTIDSNLGWYMKQISMLAIDDIPTDMNGNPSADIVIEDDKISIVSNEYEVGIYGSILKPLDGWKETHGARFNKLAQAISNMDGVPLSESIRKLAAANNLVSIDSQPVGDGVVTSEDHRSLLDEYYAAGGK